MHTNRSAEGSDQTAEVNSPPESACLNREIGNAGPPPSIPARNPWELFPPSVLPMNSSPNSMYPYRGTTNWNCPTLNPTLNQYGSCSRSFPVAATQNSTDFYGRVRYLDPRAVYPHQALNMIPNRYALYQRSSIPVAPTQDFMYLQGRYSDPYAVDPSRYPDRLCPPGPIPGGGIQEPSYAIEGTRFQESTSPYPRTRNVTPGTVVPIPPYPRGYYPHPSFQVNNQYLATLPHAPGLRLPSMSGLNTGSYDLSNSFDADSNSRNSPTLPHYQRDESVDRGRICTEGYSERTNARTPSNRKRKVTPTEEVATNSNAVTKFMKLESINDSEEPNNTYKITSSVNAQESAGPNEDTKNIGSPSSTSTSCSSTPAEIQDLDTVAPNGELNSDYTNSGTLSSTSTNRLSTPAEIQDLDTVAPNCELNLDNTNSGTLSSTSERRLSTPVEIQDLDTVAPNRELNSDYTNSGTVSSTSERRLSTPVEIQDLDTVAPNGELNSDYTNSGTVSSTSTNRLSTPAEIQYLDTVAPNGELNSDYTNSGTVSSTRVELQCEFCGETFLTSHGLLTHIGIKHTYHDFNMHT